MLLTEFFQPVLEARVRQPILVYHGTTDANLRSILINGMQPFPKKRAWADDPDAGGSVLSRKSMGGSYWTSDFMTAYGSARRAIQKLGGKDRLIVAALINEQSAFADEDDINGPLQTALGEMLKTVGFAPSMDHLGHLTGYFWGKFTKPEKAKELVDIFRNTLSAKLGEKYVLPFDQAEIIVQAFILRRLANIEQGYYRDRYLNDAGAPELQVPTKEEAEHQCWEIRQQLTRTLKKRAYRRTDPNKYTMVRPLHSFRTEEVVGYRGRNRIVCVATIDTIPDQIPAESITVYYGEIPDGMQSAYERTIGTWPRIIRNT